MAHQRRGERHGHRARRGSRLAGVVLVGLSLALGCSAGSREPTGLGGAPGSGGGSGGGGGGTGGGSTAAALVGSWRNITILQTVGDLRTVTTTWSFDATGGCSRTVTSLSALVGVPLSETRGCRFTLGNFQLLIRFDQAAQAVTFPFRFAGVSSTRLVLAGQEFEKLTG